jgi:hypothetical protein
LQQHFNWRRIKNLKPFCYTLTFCKVSIKDLDGHENGIKKIRQGGHVLKYLGVAKTSITKISGDGLSQYGCCLLSGTKIYLKKEHNGDS